MSGRQSAEVKRALKLVASGWTPYKAAKHCGVAASTVYRAKARSGKQLDSVTAAVLTETPTGPI